jgi:hypothetical protein
LSERLLHRSSLAASLALAAPFVVPLSLSLYVLVGWVSGGNPFWTVPDLTLSEATMVRDAGEAVRLIRAGHDPNRAWPVRADLSDSGQPEVLTPLEAAVQIRRLEFVQLLVREGARMTAAERSTLVDRARRLGAGDITDYLQAAAQ